MFAIGTKMLGLLIADGHSTHRGFPDFARVAGDGTTTLQSAPSTVAVCGPRMARDPGL